MHSRQHIARPNLFLGIALTKKQRHANAVQKMTLARSKYLEAKQKALQKGKTVYPDDPKGEAKGPWKDWQKWRGKAGERAMKVAEAAEKKGRLDPLAAAELQRDMAAAMVEDPGALVLAVEAGQVPDTVLDANITTSPASGIPTWAWVGGGTAASILLFLALRAAFRR